MLDETYSTPGTFSLEPSICIQFKTDSDGCHAFETCGGWAYNGADPTISLQLVASP